LEPYAVDMRDAFFDEINRLAAKNRDVLLLTDDQGAFSLEWLRENLPEQYFNVGVAEQNLISVAAGLALGGKIPIVYGISPFMTLRCYEQVRNDLCCMELPVTIVASGAGYSYGGDGPTHHATQDVAIMRALPDMTILNPSDAVSTTDFARMACLEPVPKYVRIERSTLGKIYDNGHDFSAGLDLLVDGPDLVIISTGIMTHQALQAAEELARRGVAAGVIDLYRLKPVDEEALLEAIGDTPRIVTLEEHSLIGGLGSLVCEILSDHGRPIPVKRIGLPDRYLYKYGSREWLQALVGLDLDSIVNSILGWEPEGRPIASGRR
ncbi:MAG TPA: transketolase C-terminal domain-containing protein, partial [Dehalococcoidia bacterium]|nr:transketolase C-terminal domain-containing protein [Dehalococcoidia bacterium]